jgi:hypothetical protein
MPTVAEILEQTGLTKEQIAAFDAKAISAFGGILTTAEQKEAVAKAAEEAATVAARQAEEARVAAKAAQDAAEFEKRSNVEFYEQKIIPGLTGFDDEKKVLETAKINAEALAAFYKAQNEAARASGFVPADAPQFTPPSTPPGNQSRDQQGRFVPNAPGSTPGSPTFVNEADFYKRIDTGLGTVADIQWKHQMLYGRPLPVSPSDLIKQADALKLSPMEYAARTFKFAEKEEEMRQLAVKAHDDEIANRVAQEKQKEYEVKEAALRADFAAEKKTLAERVGNNPELRVSGPAKIADVRAAMKTGDVKDPVKLTEAERRAATRQLIRKDLEAQESAVA